MPVHKFEGFPVIQDLNYMRNDLYEGYRRESEKQKRSDFTPIDENRNSFKIAAKKTACWAGHKVITGVCIPTNAIGIGGGIGLMLSAALLVAPLKIALFTVTLGHCKWPKKTGLNIGARFTKHSFYELFRNIGQLGRDGIRLIRYGIHRHNVGLKNAVKHEGEVKLKHPPGLKKLNKTAIKGRIGIRQAREGKKTAAYGTIVKHTGISLIAMPLNAAGAAVYGVASAPLSAVFFAKVILKTYTNLSIPVPTKAGQSLAYSAACTANVGHDLATCVADNGIFLAKILDDTGLLSIGRLFKYVGAACLDRGGEEV